MPLFRKERKSRLERKNIPITLIKDSLLDLIISCAKDSHPKEFGAILKCREPGIIDELNLLPGTIAGEESALFRLHMLPIDFELIGTVHSHPSPVFLPSGADLEFFEHFGKVHIIIAYPYTKKSWNAYNFKGEVIKLEILE